MTPQPARTPQSTPPTVRSLDHQRLSAEGTTPWKKELHRLATLFRARNSGAYAGRAIMPG
jgi:hypothetical protein